MFRLMILSMPYAVLTVFQEKSAGQSLKAVFCRNAWYGISTLYDDILEVCSFYGGPFGDGSQQGVQVAGSGERTRKKLYFTCCNMMEHAVLHRIMVPPLKSEGLLSI